MSPGLQCTPSFLLVKWVVCTADTKNTNYKNIYSLANHTKQIKSKGSPFKLHISVKIYFYLFILFRNLKLNS